MVPEENRLMLKISKWLLILMAVFFIIAIVLAVLIFNFENKYKDKIYPGIFIGNLDVGGKTPSEAKVLLSEKINIFNQNGINFTYHDSKDALMPLIASLESDHAYEIITFEIDKTVLHAYEIGRHGSWPQKLKEHAEIYLNPKTVKAFYSINNEGEIENFLKNSFSKYESPAEDAKLAWEEFKSGENPNFYVEEEKFGQVLEYERGTNALKDKLSLLDFSAIELSAMVNYPLIYKKYTYSINEKAAEIYEKAPITLTYENDKWKIEGSGLLGFLTLKMNSDKEVIVGLDENKFSEYLNEKVAPKINREPVEAKFEVLDGRVSEFQASQPGLLLNAESSFYKIEEGLLTSTSTEYELIADTHKSGLATEDINDLGIKEIIGTGHSSFAGSPNNRRHNIAIGAAAVNGTLIKPGEEFSLLKVLGNIDKAAGYLPELVIKDNRTIPEYGGGLCQIGTTVFRATTRSGLPVTMRRNHSYRVSYYEPAGTDATIYNPWPDYKFLNDTGHHVLIQSRVKGDDIYFDFWGTKDGRGVEVADPVIYNIVKPGPTKIIETADLAPGVKKCTENAHNGADAYFDYTVSYSKENPPKAVMEKIEKGEEVKDEDYIIKKRFSSHYVPWRAVCLVGIDPNKKTEPSPPATPVSN
jgi:vancomycin resistance protein YoaR